MAIAVMKKVVFLAEQRNKELLLESLQEMKGTQVFPFKADEFADEILVTETSSQKSDLANYRYNKSNELIDFLDNYVPQLSLLKKMRQKKPVLTLNELDQEIDEERVTRIFNHVEAQRERLSVLDNDLKVLEEEERFLRRWTSLPFDPNVTEEFKYFDVVVGSIENEKSAKFIEDLLASQDDQITIKEVFITDDQNGYMLIYPRHQEESVAAIIRASDFERLDYRYSGLPQEVLQEKLNQRKQLIEEQKEIRQALKKDDESLHELQLTNEYYSNLLAREEASEFILNSSHLFVLQGWMDEDTVEEQVKNVYDKLGSDSVVYYTYDVQDEEIPEVPTKLNNNAFNEAFETLTLQFGTPKYDEIDPTPFFSLFHVLFFGIMSADAGYGILLFLGTLIPLLTFELSAGMRKNLKMFNFMSIGTILVGLFFGSFFGFDLPFRVMSLSDQVVEIMAISVAIGILHMLLAYTLKAYLTAKNKEYASLYLDSLMWILMFAGVIVIVINTLLGWNDPLLQNIGLFLILGNIVGMFIVNIIAAGNPFIGFGQGLFGLMGLAGVVGDVVSYTRLTALAVAGANIAMAFNLIVGLFPPIARFTIGILLFLALQALNIFITFLGAYVHSMRLEFVEFFGKFFDGGGNAFKPLKTVDKHIWVRSQNEK